MRTPGRYCISSKKPIYVLIDGTSTKDVYPQPGDIVWVPLLCEFVEVLEPKAKELSIGESMLINISIEAV